MVSLSDGVVRLRPPDLDDVPAIHAACQDPEILRWTTLPSPYLVEHATGFVIEYCAPGWASWAEHGARQGTVLVWAILAGDRLAGVIDLRLQPVGSAAVGYWLAPHARGRGVLHRALLLALAWGFDDPDGPGLDRVEWQALAGNWPSWRVAWRAGFRFEAVVRGGLVDRDVRTDSWTATITKDDRREPGAAWPATTVPAPVPPER